MGIIFLKYDKLRTCYKYLNEFQFSEMHKNERMT